MIPIFKSKNIVFESKLDNKYDVTVTSYDNKYSGILKITLGNKIIHEQLVNISYGATFGPDVADVDYWQQICCDVIDTLEGKCNDKRRNLC